MSNSNQAPQPITAATVKALRDRTGAAMMDCKRALQDAKGDIEKAIHILNIDSKPGSGRSGPEDAAPSTETIPKGPKPPNPLSDAAES